MITISVLVIASIPPLLLFPSLVRPRYTNSSTEGLTKKSVGYFSVISPRLPLVLVVNENVAAADVVPATRCNAAIVKERCVT